MILSDRELLMEIEAGHLVFDPPVTVEDMSTTSVDLHLGNDVGQFRVPPGALQQRIDLSHDDVGGLLGDGDGSIIEWRKLLDDGFELAPDQFVLAYTREKLTLPAHLAARVEGRSTIARFGIGIHSTAPTVHATFSGHLTLEIANHGPIPCLLVPGMAICQLIVERVMVPPLKTLQSRWMGQAPPGA